jgi:hypothetical protein
MKEFLTEEEDVTDKRHRRRDYIHYTSLAITVSEVSEPNGEVMNIMRYLI